MWSFCNLKDIVYFNFFAVKYPRARARTPIRATHGTGTPRVAVSAAARSFEGVTAVSVTEVAVAVVTSSVAGFLMVSVRTGAVVFGVTTGEVTGVTIGCVIAMEYSPFEDDEPRDTPSPTTSTPVSPKDAIPAVGAFTTTVKSVLSEVVQDGMPMEKVGLAQVGVV